MAQMVITFFSLFLSFALLQIQGSQPVEYIVENQVPDSPGGQRFDREIGINFTRNVLANSTEFILNLFNQKSFDETRGYTQVSWYLNNVGGLAVTFGNLTQVNVLYVQDFQGDLKTDLSGLIFHENTHVWQWFGNDKNVGVVEGIADYVMYVAGLAPNPWLQPGEGERWDEGYAVTARFFEYLESLEGGFVTELNKKMKDDYSDEFFVELLGKPVDQLWKEYKDKYKH